jgi:hypothetical protein
MLTVDALAAILDRVAPTVTTSTNADGPLVTDIRLLHQFGNQGNQGNRENKHGGAATAAPSVRAGRRAYRVRVAMGQGQPDKWTIMLAPGCDLAEASRTAREQFGPHRVREVREQKNTTGTLVPTRA